MRRDFRVYRVVFSVLIGVLFASCTPEEESGTGKLTIRWKLVYGGSPLEMFQLYTYPRFNDSLYFSRISYFISDLSLHRGTDLIIIKDVDYLNLTSSHTAPVSVNGLEYTLEGLPTGNYSGLSFGVGLPSAKNALRPIDYPATSILSSSAEYWSSWKSYIFFRPEGRISINGQPVDQADFALHLGADATFRRILQAHQIRINKNQETFIEIQLDMRKFFDGVHFHDIEVDRQMHSLFQVPIMVKLADNLATAFQVK